MEEEELNKCLRKFYMAARKHNGGYYNKAMLNSIIAATDRHLRSQPDNNEQSKCFIKQTINFSLVCDEDFSED